MLVNLNGKGEPASHSLADEVARHIAAMNPKSTEELLSQEMISPKNTDGLVVGDYIKKQGVSVKDFI